MGRVSRQIGLRRIARIASFAALLILPIFSYQVTNAETAQLKTIAQNNNTVQSIINLRSSDVIPSSDQVYSDINLGNFRRNFGSPQAIIATIFRLAIIIAGVIFLFILLFGGLTYMTAGGSDDGTTKAKKMMTNGLIGLIIVLLSYGVGTWLLRELGYNLDGSSRTTTSRTASRRTGLGRLATPVQFQTAATGESANNSGSGLTQIDYVPTTSLPAPAPQNSGSSPQTADTRERNTKEYLVFVGEWPLKNDTQHADYVKPINGAQLYIQNPNFNRNYLGKTKGEGDRDFSYHTQTTLDRNAPSAFSVSYLQNYKILVKAGGYGVCEQTIDFRSSGTNLFVVLPPDNTSSGSLKEFNDRRNCASLMSSFPPPNQEDQAEIDSSTDQPTQNSGPTIRVRQMGEDQLLVYTLVSNLTQLSYQIYSRDDAVSSVLENFISECEVKPDRRYLARYNSSARITLIKCDYPQSANDFALTGDNQTAMTAFRQGANDAYSNRLPETGYTDDFQSYEEGYKYGLWRGNFYNCKANTNCKLKDAVSNYGSDSEAESQRSKRQTLFRQVCEDNDGTFSIARGFLNIKTGPQCSVRRDPKSWDIDHRPSIIADRDLTTGSNQNNQRPVPNGWYDLETGQSSTGSSNDRLTIPQATAPAGRTYPTSTTNTVTTPAGNQNSSGLSGSAGASASYANFDNSDASNQERGFFGTVGDYFRNTWSTITDLFT